MVSWLLLRAYLLVFLGQSLADDYKHSPDWEGLKNQVKGRLFQGVPFSKPCFSNFDSSECAAVRQNYPNEVTRSNHFGAYQQLQWETCQATGAQCLLDQANLNSTEPTISTQCKQGSVSPYYIDVRNPSDITAAFKFSKRFKVPLTIKNTGHDYKGRSSAPNSLALWTHNLKNLSYHPTFVPTGCSSRPRQAVTMGAGVQWGEAYKFADDNGVTVVGGSDISVGAAGGWLQGGGHSILSPTMGLGVDRVLEYKVVTPDGIARVANECQNTDLFWALRGGGGSTFGVVTEATVLASPPVKVQTFIMTFSPNINSTALLWTIMVDNQQKWAKQGFGGFSLANAAIFVNTRLSNADTKASLAPVFDFANQVKAQDPAATLFFEELPTFKAFIDLFVSEFLAVLGNNLALSSRLISKSVFETAQGRRSLASALMATETQVPGVVLLLTAPTAFEAAPGTTSVTEAWRSSLYHVTTLVIWSWNATLAEKKTHYSRVSQAMDNLRRLTPGSGAYQNEADVHEPNFEVSFWGSNYPRLLKIKNKYDPHGLLRCWQCAFLGATVYATALSTNGDRALTNHPRRYEIPILRKTEGRSNLRRRGAVAGESGLGNNADTLYSVPIELGNMVAAVNLDTGSSDLWVVSDACTTHACAGAQVKRYPSSAANSTGVDVNFRYGDSSTGTYAVGKIGLETATIAGIAMTEQPFAFINDTTNSIVEYGIAGLFGLGFPSGSKIHEAIVNAHGGFTTGTDEFMTSINTYGPLLSRLTMTNALEAPLFSVMLQRSTIDINGNGKLTIGKLPDGIDYSSLTWIPVRLYQPDEGGLSPPHFTSNEVYPLRWEIEIDSVFFDGEQLPDSAIPASRGINSMKTSALIDTGNSFLRGPEDVVNKIFRTVSPSYVPADRNSKPRFPCNTPHHLAFRIGGQMFPIDPRDFIGQSEPNDATTCIADNLVPTDPPRFGSLFRWNLGDPFFKSNLVVFYYGNLTHPSVDPPRIGLLSLVPGNADDLLAQAVSDAQNHGGNFEETLVEAPTASAAAAPQVTALSESTSMNLATGTTLLAGPSPIADVKSQVKESSSVSRCVFGRNGVWVVMITIFLVQTCF